MTKERACLMDRISPELRNASSGWINKRFSPREGSEALFEEVLVDSIDYQKGMVKYNVLDNESESFDPNSLRTVSITKFAELYDVD